MENNKIKENVELKQYGTAIVECIDMVYQCGHINKHERDSLIKNLYYRSYNVTKL